MTEKSEEDNYSNKVIIDEDADEIEKPSTFETYEHLICWLGGRKLYSLIILAGTFLLLMFPAFASLSHNFLAASPKFWCNDSVPEMQNYTADRCSITISEDQCSFKANCTNYDNTHFLQSLKCKSWVYDLSVYTSTIVSRFNLVCDDAFYSSMPSTAYFAGVLIGSSLYGFLADKLGRQKTDMIAFVNLMIMTLCAAVSPSYWLYALSQFLVGIGNGGVMTTTFTLCLESTDVKNRASWVFLMTNGWAIGMLLLAPIAYLNSNYQIILTVTGLTMIISFPILFLLGESVRWQVSTGQYSLADKAVKRISRLNKKMLPADFTTAQFKGLVKKDTKSASIIDLFRTPGIRKLTILTWLLYCFVSLSYYGISLGVGFLGGNIYLNQVYSALVEPPARFLGVFLSLKISRRLSLVLTFFLAGVSLIVTAFLFSYETLIWLRVAFAMHGKFWITIAFDLVWIYAGEAFPTVLRSAGVGSGSTMARVGSMLSTMIGMLSLYWKQLPFAILGIGPFISCALVFFLPETSGVKLTETIEEGEAFANSNSKTRNKKVLDGNKLLALQKLSV